MQVQIKQETLVNITPELLAEVFWGLDSVAQADFFGALAKLIPERSPDAYNYGEMQWWHLHKDLQAKYAAGDKEPLRMYLAMSCFAFEFSQKNCGLNQYSAY